MYIYISIPPSLSDINSRFVNLVDTLYASFILKVSEEIPYRISDAAAFTNSRAASTLAMYSLHVRMHSTVLARIGLYSAYHFS